MKQHLENLLAAQRNLTKAAQDLADFWAQDEKTRNRAERQKLTGELMENLPRPAQLAAFGNTVYKIAKVCEVEL